MKEPPFAELRRSYVPAPVAASRRGFSIRPWLLLAVMIGAGWLLGMWLMPASYREPSSHQAPYSTDSPGSDATQLWPLSKPSPTLQVEAQATPQPSSAVAVSLDGSSRALTAVQVGVPVLNRQPAAVSAPVQSTAAQEVMSSPSASAEVQLQRVPGPADMTSGPAVADQQEQPEPRPSWSPAPAPSQTPTSRPTPSGTPSPSPTPSPTPTPGKEPGQDGDKTPQTGQNGRGIGGCVSQAKQALSAAQRGLSGRRSGV